MPPKGSKGKRAISCKEIGKKKAKLASEWEEMKEAEKDNEHTKSISWVMTQMLADRENVEVAKVATQGRYTRLAAKDKPVQEKQWYPKAYICLYKIPRDGCLSKTLPRMSSRMTDSATILLRKADKRIDQKLIYFGSGTS